MKKPYRILLMDLDGTITDPVVGITKSVEYALNHFGITVNDLHELCPFIGPPLRDSFKEFYHFTDAQANEASIKYGERFADKGLYENELYDDMNQFLQMATNSGKTLMLATSKPTFLAEKILDYFHISKYFTFVGGSGVDGSGYTKTDVIRYVLNSNGIIDLSEVVMIGDRKHDIIGAKETGIDSIGVLYGYGDYEELSRAGATYIVKDIDELGKMLI